MQRGAAPDWNRCASPAAVVLTLLLMPVCPGDEVAWAQWIWPTGVDAASSLLQTVATSVMTAATVTFSLTVVALQLGWACCVSGGWPCGSWSSRVRTPEQDAALGLRQLTDIAVKAIFPSINDPITAAHATC